MLTSRGLPSDSTCVLKAEPRKLDFKRREPGILFISLLGLARLIEISVNRSIYKRKTIIDMKIQKSVTFNVCSVYLFN